MGYFKINSLYYPFIIQDRMYCFYGYEGLPTERTNLDSRLIQIGEQFTVFDTSSNIEAEDAVYEIISCHSYVD